MWSSVVPNAELIVLPYPLEDPAQWVLQLFISPSAQVGHVVLGLGITLALLALPILFFTWQEKREDVIQKQESAHLFSYDAL